MAGIQRQRYLNRLIVAVLCSEICPFGVHRGNNAGGIVMRAERGGKWLSIEGFGYYCCIIEKEGVGVKIVSVVVV